VIHAIGASLLGVVWGWLLVLAAAPATRRTRTVVMAGAGTLAMMLGILALHPAPSVLWFAGGTLIGAAAHAACRHAVRRHVNGGTR
jgi:hypothetical protein